MKVVPIIVGPTGVGKTEISVLLSKYLPVEIISADSRQIYRYLDIGTAKPDKKLLMQIPHHFIDALDPSEEFNAGRFEHEARSVIDQVFERMRVPLVVGGSGFYINALIDGLPDIVEVGGEMRVNLKKRLAVEGVEKLYEELQQVDPDLARKLAVKDKQRIIRGLEVYYASGSRLSRMQTRPQRAANFKPLMIGLTADREVLYGRINRRVDVMLETGLVAEVQKLSNLGLTPDLNALNTVGYKEVYDYLSGATTYEEMTEEIKKNSRRYAKRQLTWFRRDKRIQWLEINTPGDVETTARRILDIYKNGLSENVA